MSSAQKHEPRPAECDGVPSPPGFSIQAIKEHWRQFKKSRPGSRFQERYWRRQKECRGKVSIGKVLNIVFGIVLVAGGLVLIPAPGPGFPVVVLGLAMIASEFLALAKLMDRAEPRLRNVYAAFRKRWRTTSAATRALVGLVMASSACFMAYATWRFLV